jgi:hypothetical protein
MAGDPQFISSTWCDKCNGYHISNNGCNNNSYPLYFASTNNHDAEILALLQKILDKLEEIRMEI